MYVSNPDTLSANVLCGQPWSDTLNISDTLGGTLAYTLSGASSQTIRVLMMTYGTDVIRMVPNTITALNQHFSNYVLTQSSTSDPGVLQGLLVGKNILLIPRQKYGDPLIWNTLAPVIQAYVNNGGSILWLGTYSSEADCIFTTNIFSGIYSGNSVFNTLRVVDPTHPMTQGLMPTFNAVSGCWNLDISNTDKVQLVKDDLNNKDILAYRYYGVGRIDDVKIICQVNCFPTSIVTVC